MSDTKETYNVEDTQSIPSSTSHQPNNELKGESYEQHLINFGKPWYRVPSLIKLNLLIFAVSLASISNGYDGSMLNGLQSLESWQSFFGHPKGWRLGLLSAGLSIGNVIATFRTADYIADKFGRRWAIVIGQSAMIIGAVIQGSARNYGQFFVARIILGITYIANATGPVLVSEIAYPSHRSIATAIYSTTWYFGSLVASGVTYGTYLHIADDNSWRIPSYLQGVFALISLILIYWTPESPRFLVDKGKVEEAREILIKFHANGDAELGKDLVDFEIREIEEAIEVEKIGKNTSFKAFFKTKNNFHRFFIVCFIGFMMNFSGNGLVSYYLALVLTSIGITSSKRQLQINIWLAFYNYGVSLISAYLSSKLRRRFMFLTSVGTMLVAYVIWTILSAINQKTNFVNSSLGSGVLAMIFIFYLAYNFALNVLPGVYTTELMPYHLRAKGYSVLSLVCVTGNVYNSFVNPIAMEAIDWKYYIVYCCLLAFNLIVVYLTFVETFGYSLEEVSLYVFKEEAPSLIVPKYLRRSKKVEKV